MSNRKEAGSSAAASATVRRNAKGGVYVSQQEVKQAFEFLDSGRKGHITVQDLRDKLGVFYKNLTSKDYRFLMQNKVPTRPTPIRSSYSPLPRSSHCRPLAPPPPARPS